MSYMIIYYVTFESLPVDRSRNWIINRFDDILEREKAIISKITIILAIYKYLSSLHKYIHAIAGQLSIKWDFLQNTSNSFYKYLSKKPRF